MNKISGEIDTSSDGRAARWERHRHERRAELLSKARKAIHHLGPQASMDDIAAHGATSKPVYYRYFGDKEGLRQALGEVVIGDFRDQVLAAGLAGHDERDALHAMVTAYLQLAETSPNLYFFVTAQSGDVLTAPEPAADGSKAVLNAFFDEITRIMAERVAAYYAARTSGAAPAIGLWPRAALGMIRSAGELWLRQPPGAERPALEELAEALCTWLTHGIAPTQSGA